MILEDIISAYNTKRTFKVLAFIVLSLPAFQYGSQMQNILFSIYVPNHNCQYNSLIENHSVSQDQCSVSVNGSSMKCSKWNFSSIPVGRTMVSDYDLVCDKRYLGDLTVVIWYCTYLTQPFVGCLSDRYGRKILVLLNLLIETAFSISLAFAPDIITNIILRVFIGISANGLYICYVWLLEMVNIEYRGFVGSFYFLYSCLAEMVFPLTAYYSLDWRKTQLLSMIPSILYLFILFFPESPRWLAVNNRKQDAVQSLERIAKINNMESKISPEDLDEESYVDDESLLDALKEPIFSYYLTITLFIAFSSYLSYSVIMVKQDFFHKNIFISMFIQGLMDFPALFLSFCFFKYFKRKHGFIILNTTGTCLLLISICFSHDVLWQLIIRIILGCIAKISLMSSNQNLMIYCSELYPTTHRSFGQGMIQIVNILSFTIAFYITRMTYVHYVTVNVINFLIMCATTVIIYKYLPETKDLPFPESTDDQKMLTIGNENKFLTYMKDRKAWNKEERPSENSNELTNLLDKTK